MWRPVMVASALVAALVTTLPAQSRPVELGAGLAGVTLSFSGGQTVFSFEVSEQIITAAFYVSDRVALEPFLSTSVTVTDDANLISIGTGLGLPYYFRETTGKSGAYVRPFAAVSILSADVLAFSDSEAQFAAGLGLGLKSPLGARVSLRSEAVLRYQIESDVFDDAFVIGGVFGIAVFLGG